MTDKYGLNLNDQPRTQSANYPYADLTPDQRTGARYAGIGGLPPDLRPPDGATQRQQPGILDRLGQRIREAPQRAAARREKAAGIYDSLNRTAEDYAQRIRGLAVQQGGGVRGGAAATGALVRDFATAPVRGYGLIYDEVAKPAAQAVTQNVTGPFVDALTGNTQSPGGGFGLTPAAQAAPGQGEGYTLQTPISQTVNAQPPPQQPFGLAPDITRQVQGGQTRYDTPQGSAMFQGTPGAAARRLGVPQGGGFSVASGRSPEMQAAVDRNVGQINQQIAALQAQRGTPRPIEERVNVIGDGGGFGLLSNEHEAMRRAQMDAAGLPTKRRADYLQAVLPGHLAATGAKPPADPRVGLDLARLQQDQAEFQAGLAADQTKQQQAAAQQDFENRLAQENLGLDRDRLALDRKKADQKAGEGTDYAAAIKTGVAQMIADGFEPEQLAEYLDRQLGSLSKVLGQPVFFYQGEVITQAEIAETAKREDVKAAAAKAGVAPTAFVMDLLRKQGGFYQPGKVE